jgi:hypothetical protein
VSKVITDAELVNKFAQQAMEEQTQVIETKAPPGPEVELPGGFIDGNTLVTTVEVRELNGMDEEAIAKASNTGKALNVLLQRGLVKVGSRPALLEDLDLFLSGDRDAILIGIRRITFGKTLDVNALCPNCGTKQDVSIDLKEDIPVTKLNDPIADRTWSIKTKNGVVTVALPTGVTQKRLMDNSDKTSAELSTILLSGCVQSVNGEPSLGASTVLNLGIADRAKIVEEIMSRTPGPRLGEVSKTCKACGEAIALPLSLVDLFRL